MAALRRSLGRVRFLYLTLVLADVSLRCSGDRQTQDPAPSIVLDAPLVPVAQLLTLFGPPVCPTGRVFRVCFRTARSGAGST